MITVDHAAGLAPSLAPAPSVQCFELRGVIEGFYGPPFTFPERDSLIEFAGQHGYNWYIYAPKNDRQGRSRWWEPYPAKIMDRFAATVRLAERSGISFCYAISPGVSICYASTDDFERITNKLLPFYNLGVRSFALLLDDIVPGFFHAADRAAYASYAAAHADLTNRVHEWLLTLDPGCTLAMCPVDYHGVAPFSPYLAELGEGLHPAIDILYTGPDVCSSSISLADAEDFGGVAQRRPIIWDNYPVNDLAMKSEMHLGPIRGRDPDLYRAARGVAVNVMTQAEASRIPLLTFAAYLADPAGYDPGQSWISALRQVAGEESWEDLRLFAENSMGSCLGTPQSRELELLTAGALAALRRGEKPLASPAVHALDQYIARLDEARYRLTNWMDNLALRNDLLPWLELLDLWCWMAKRALAALYALERGEGHEEPLRLMHEWLEAIRRNEKRICGTVLLELAGYISELAERSARSGVLFWN